jgi:hypothetical protein
MADMQAQEAEEEVRQEQERLEYLAAHGGGDAVAPAPAVDNRESWLIDQERQEAEEAVRQEQERLEYLASKAAGAEGGEQGAPQTSVKRLTSTGWL